MFSGLSKIVRDMGTHNLQTSYFKNVDNNTLKKMTLPERKVRHILELNRQEKQEFFNSFDIVLSDCDGVLWEIFRPIPRASEAVQLLRKSGKKFACMSNNSVRKKVDYEIKLNAFDPEFNMNDLHHPATTIVAYLKKIKFDGLIYCIGMAPLIDALKESGFKVIDIPTKLETNESFLELIKNTVDSEPVQAVIMDGDFNFCYSKLVRAGSYLKNPDCLFIAGATDTVLPIGKNLELPGPGYFIQMLEDSSKRKATVLGKPGLPLGDILVDHYGIKNRKRALFIGDMLEQDIGFGRKCGFQTLAVLTGGCKKEDFDTHPRLDELPDYYADSLADLIDLIEELQTEGELKGKI